MDTSISISLYVLLFAFVNCVIDEMDVKCHIDPGKVILDCKGLESINQNLSKLITKNTTVLILRDTQNLNFIQNWHTSPSYLNLVSFEILNSGLNLKPFSFSGLSSLVFLEIRGNEWNEINGNTFFGLAKLKELDISRNKIRKLHVLSLAGLIKLETLDLSNNLIETVPPFIFDQLKNLNYLILRNNYIRTIDNNIFNGLNSLKKIVLTNNFLISLNADEFNKLENLEELYVSRNGLTKIVNDLKLPKLEWLEIFHNNLSYLSPTVFEQCKHLKMIDLSNNNLKTLTEEPFLQLKSLSTLNIFNNSVDLRKFENLKSIFIIHGDYRS